jgi:hypothetical protein
VKRLWLLSPFLVLLTADASAQTCSPTTFATAEPFPAPSPTQVVVANFNGDTFPDIAVASGNLNEIAVLLNDGSGGFGPPIVSTILENPAQIAAADLRGNGTTDLVIAVYDGIDVLLGNGDGTFAAPVFYPSNMYGGWTLVVGTFDANESPDVILASQYQQSTVFFAGHGDGTFASAVPMAVTVTSGLASGDFNGDSKLDLVVSNSNAGTISVYLGHGDGTFGPPADFVAGSGPGSLAVGDLDGDGHADVAVATPGFVSVLIGNGNGTFQAALQYPAGPAPTALAIADFDLDGQQDVAVVDNQLNAVGILFGVGGGALSPLQAYLIASRASGLAVGDLDTNGLADIVSGDSPDSAVVVLRNAGQGDFLGVPLSTVPFGPFQNSLGPQIVEGDWNGDGRQDLAWTNGSGINLFESLGGGHFAPTAVLAVTPGNPSMFGLASGDLTGDGKTDLVSADFSNVYLFTGNGDGTFNSPSTIVSNINAGAIAVADFTGDGKLDVAVSPSCCSSALTVLPGNGDGTFQNPVFTQNSFGAGLLIAADLNSDGHPDLIESGSSSVYVQISNGDGTFQPPSLVFSNGGCCQGPSIAVGAFTGGPLDLLVSYGNTSVSLYPGNGDGTFGPPIFIALSYSSGGVTVGDFDGDTHLDFAVYSSNGDVLVFPGLGNRHFQAPVIYPATSGTVALVTGDFTGGGWPDIAAAGQAISTLVNAHLGVTVPLPPPVIVGSTATLTASASGYGPVQYQWRLDGTPLSDGGRYSGTTTAQLTVADAQFSDVHTSYDVVVTDSCTSATSEPQVGLQVAFADVPPSNIFYADVNTVAAFGIAAGCGGANFCPTSPTTRAQMAVFLLKGEHGSAYVPPSCTGHFADVPCPGTFADWIEQLASEGVTAGCGGGNYCPDASVTRAQMAVFLEKTSQGPAYVPPPAIGIFGDVPPGSFAADWIEALYNAGVTAGCSTSPRLFCPGNAVNRGQMAVFLVKTFFLFAGP